MGTRQQQFDKTARILNVISNPFRLKIIHLLTTNGKELSVSELNQKLNLEQSLISHHLIRLRDTGVLQSRREGRSVYYSIIEDGSNIKPILTLITAEEAWEEEEEETE
jgi:DNA-binding transcriptional ArsR family regulator